jgi:lycopene beta-cyclase
MEHGATLSGDDERRYEDTTAMELDAEHLIVGAGCAGLSLAVRLARRDLRERGRILIVDPREELEVGDRTWCSWGGSGATHPFASCVSHRWTRWRVRSASVDVERSLPSRPYERIPSDAFVREALRVLEAAPGVVIRTGTRVSALRDEGATVRAECEGGGGLRGRLAWDARGGAPATVARPGDVSWLQHFVGWEVRTERAIFDPGVAMLMDLRVDQGRGPHFVYVLPFARDRALVEDTYFSERALEEREYASSIERWLEEHRAGSWEIERTERGAIPMSTAPIARRAGPRIVPIGLRGGAAKPSTGYAFAFVQRHCDALARVAGDGRTVPPEVPVRSRVATFFDRVFLSYLRRVPESAPEVFGGLFARADPAAIVRFLSEEGGAADHLAVMRAVPRLGVAAEAVRARDLWMRAR